MPQTVIYTDDAGRIWRVREIVSYADSGTPAGAFPNVVRAAVIFDGDGGRRIADDAPLDWRERPDLLHTLFARARLPSQEY